MIHQSGVDFQVNKKTRRMCAVFGETQKLEAVINGQQAHFEKE